MKKKILLIGGGTGGHILPLKNLAEEFLIKNCDVELIVSNSELDKKIIKENFAGFSVSFFETDKIRRYLSWKNLSAPFKILKSIFEAKDLLKKIKPDVVFFKGGFVGFPFLVNLFLFHSNVKIYSHESDIESGKLTLLANKIADKVYHSFGNSSYPLFFSNNEKIVYKKTEKPKILLFGGSQGAQFLNEIVEKNISKLLEDFDVKLVTGVKKSIKQKNFAGFEQIEMLSVLDMHKEICSSDLIVARAGANSLFEIISAKKPSVIIPLPSAANNHQEKNAQYFAQKGLCYVFHQNKNRNFCKTIKVCLDDDDLKNKLNKSNIKNSAKIIVKEILNDLN